MTVRHSCHGEALPVAESHGTEEGHFDSPHHFIPEDVLVLQCREVSSRYTQTAAASLGRTPGFESWICLLPAM